MDPQAPNTPAPEIPQVIQPPNHSNNITIISMAIFVLLSLGAVAFLYYQNQQLKGMLASYQTKLSPAPAPSPIPNLGLPTNTFEYCGSSQPRTKFSVDPTTGWSVLTGNSSEIYQEYEITKGDESIRIVCGTGFGGGGCPGKNEKIKINGQDVDSCITTNQETNKVALSLSYLDFGGNTFSFGGLVNTRATLDQILSTFKFTETSPSSSPSASPTGY